MALFDLNTGARDEVVCGLKWDWEIEIPELVTSVFLIPKVNLAIKLDTHPLNIFVIRSFRIDRAGLAIYSYNSSACHLYF